MYIVLDAIQKGNNTIEKIIEETEIKKGIVKIFIDNLFELGVIDDYS